MQLAESEVSQYAEKMLQLRARERPRLDLIHSYLHYRPTDRRLRSLPGGRWGPLWWLATDTPPEVKRLAHVSRVDFLHLIVNAISQQMYVEGYRAPKESDNVQAWSTWQANRMDARQIRAHRGALSYGAAYVSVMPGDPVPVIRPSSARKMTAAYADDDEWPQLALEQRRQKWDSRDASYRLIDDENVWELAVDSVGKITVSAPQKHGVGVVPVVRFIDAQDEEGEPAGEVEPRIPLQDQINITTFGLLVAQHYGAFRQRYVIGWLAASEEEKLKATGAHLWQFEDAPNEVQVGEFSQTDLKGYLDSREAALRYLATVSQTPAHELLGTLANLSAEALAAAEASTTRKVDEQQTVSGESWEQVLGLAGKIQDQEPPVDAQVRWRETEARSLAQTVDALGKLSQMLGVPQSELWERVPGVSQQDVERWKAAAKEGNALATLTALLDRQAQPETPPGGTGG